MANLHKIIKSMGQQSFIAYGNGAPPKSHEEYRISNTLSQKLSIVSSRLEGRHGFYDKIKTRRLLQWIDCINPDIVHLHNIHGHYINVELLFNYLTAKEIPIIWTLHDCWSFTGHCSYYDISNCSKWQKQCEKCPGLHGYPPSLIDHSKDNYIRKRNIFTAPKNMVLITCSNWLKQETEKSFFGNKYPIHVINNGIDLNVFYPQLDCSVYPTTLKNKFIILGFANKWLHPQNLGKTAWFLDHLNDDSKLVLLGGETIPKNIVDYKNLLIVPYISSQKQLAQYYSGANVMANVTLEDNLPTVNIEALACGCPVITYNSGGSAEIISEDTGIIIERGNIEKMLEACNFIKNNPGYFSPEKCRQRAESHFDAQKQFSYYIDIYKEILNLKPQI